ncbi:MAG: alkaline phosphatase family protein [Saprospiraceae bacterium]|nr:alkaline phosphatase family protein [Saprospiraceae bacterium]
MYKSWSQIKLLFLLFTVFSSQTKAQKAGTTAPNVIIIATDGLRWQELYLGLDQDIVAATGDTSQFFEQFNASDEFQSREKLFPFVWGTLSKHGRFFGNRKLDNKVDTRNFHRFSYPGYSEFLCGTFDPFVNSNKKILNRNVSILEDLNTMYNYRGRVAAFSSWEVFPYILNEPRSGILVNAGWEACPQGIVSKKMEKLNYANQLAPAWKGETRFDDLTWQMALEYTRNNHPKALFISLDDTDHYGHKGDYGSYITAIHEFDQYLQDIWTLMQTDPFYKDNTYLIVTTDHGRGSTLGTWAKHGFLPSRSGETWFLEVGPEIKPIGEVSEPIQLWQADIANRIALNCNIKFTPHKSDRIPVIEAIEVLASKKP